jgi:choline dehydrogenase-like flavoprotein
LVAPRSRRIGSALLQYEASERDDFRHPPAGISCSLENGAIAELLAREAEQASGHLRQAFRRAARKAFLWEDEVHNLVAAKTPLTELDGIGPFLADRLMEWFEKPPPVSPLILGRFREPVRMYKAPPAHAMTEEFYETDRHRGFARGFAIQTVAPLPISFAKYMIGAKEAWGWGMRRVMMDYNHWSAFGLLGEILPWADNRVTIAKEKDQFGLPVARVTFSLQENDKKLIEFGKNKVVDVMWAAGAEEVVQEPRYAHLVGGARMGSDPSNSVVDGFGRTHDIANLFICDGSILPTQGSANPGLTIQALAARTADYLISQAKQIFNSDRRDLAAPPVRRYLSPPGTHGRGVPRLK